MLLIMGSTYEQLLDCFKNGGGIPYASFTRFHAWMSEMSGKKHEEDLIPHFVPSVDGMFFFYLAKSSENFILTDYGCFDAIYFTNVNHMRRPNYYRPGCCK